MADGDFQFNRPTKGRLVEYLPDGGTPRQLVFQYNPEKLSETKSVEWATAEIPGGDDALATFGKGSSLKLSLELMFNIYGDAPEFRSNPDYVENAIQFFHTFAEVNRQGRGAAGRRPPLLLLTIGQMRFSGALTSGQASPALPALLVRVEEVEVERLMFHPVSMKTQRAMVKAALVRHVGFPR